jgi:hypothetical protein
MTIKLFVDWHEELGHNSMYIHVYQENPNNTIYENHDVKDIINLIESGFFSWENNDQLIWYLKNCGVIANQKYEVLNHD